MECKHLLCLRDAPIPESGIGADTGVNALFVLIKYMPIPQHRYQLYFNVCDNFVKFAVTIIL